MTRKEHKSHDSLTKVDTRMYSPVVNVKGDRSGYKQTYSPQARSQDFLCGGAYLKNRDQIINVGIIRNAASKDTRGGDY